MASWSIGAHVRIWRRYVCEGKMPLTDCPLERMPCPKANSKWVMFRKIAKALRGNRSVSMRTRQRFGVVWSNSVTSLWTSWTLADGRAANSNSSRIGAGESTHSAISLSHCAGISLILIFRHLPICSKKWFQWSALAHVPDIAKSRGSPCDRRRKRPRCLTGIPEKMRVHNWG